MRAIKKGARRTRCAVLAYLAAVLLTTSALASGMHAGKFHIGHHMIIGYCADGRDCLIDKRTGKPVPSTQMGDSPYTTSEKRSLKY